MNAETWMEKFKSLVVEFYANIQHEANKIQKSNLLVEHLQLLPASYYYSKFATSKENDKNSLMTFIICVAHFYLLDDGMYPYSEKPMQSVLAVIPLDKRQFELDNFYHCLIGESSAVLVRTKCLIDKILGEMNEVPQTNF